MDRRAVIKPYALPPTRSHGSIKIPVKLEFEIVYLDFLINCKNLIV
jgi:hypothetical protein